jgi:uncharacterized protein with GYD domain
VLIVGVWSACAVAAQIDAAAAAQAAAAAVLLSRRRIGYNGALAFTSTGGYGVATYIMLSTLTPDGVQTIKNNPSRIREVNREIEQLGATVKAQWATLGHFDFVNVVEAPDEKTIARVSLELGSRGTAKYETLSAIPIDDFIGSI